MMTSSASVVLIKVTEALLLCNTHVGFSKRKERQARLERQYAGIGLVG